MVALLLVALAAVACGASADLGRVMIVGDSISHGSSRPMTKLTSGLALRALAMKVRRVVSKLSAEMLRQVRSLMPSSTSRLSGL